MGFRCGLFLANRGLSRLEVELRSVLQISPTTNHALASPSEREDAMVGLARTLMGLQHPLQLVSSARPLTSAYDWPKPPLIERRWLAVITADDEDTLTWRTRTLKSSLEGVGFCCDTRGGDPTDTASNIVQLLNLHEKA